MFCAILSVVFSVHVYRQHLIPSGSYVYSKKGRVILPTRPFYYKV